MSSPPTPPTGHPPAKPDRADPGAWQAVFPVSPATAASYGRTHHDYPATDVFAPCGSRFLAPVPGVVLEVSRADQWRTEIDDPATRGGLFVSLLGADGVRYYGSHLDHVVDGLGPGSNVFSGMLLGRIGDSGNAAGSGCHLHFGISPPCDQVGDWAVRRGVVDPWPYLDAWRAGDARSPAAAATQAQAAGACDSP